MWTNTEGQNDDFHLPVLFWVSLTSNHILVCGPACTRSILTTPIWWRRRSAMHNGLQQLMLKGTIKDLWATGWPPLSTRGRLRVVVWLCRYWLGQHGVTASLSYVHRFKCKVCSTQICCLMILQDDKCCRQHWSYCIPARKWTETLCSNLALFVAFSQPMHWHHSDMCTFILLLFVLTFSWNWP